MRVPLSKIYRAFPEFDPFPDAECERYIRYAYQQARMRIGCIPLVVFVVSLPLYAVLLSASVAGLMYVGIELPEGYLIVPVLLSASVVGVPALLALLSRDVVLRRVLKDRLRTARCPNCEFSLLGLPVVEGATRCPECGTQIVLSMHNLTPRDLEIRREEQDARPNDAEAAWETPGKRGATEGSSGGVRPS
ncbi:MAG: hypothetical protein KF699_15445 [Phycisphaeraceae bacterium]|nr:hypothetical protein [Phycisphaeraceae bacterium]MBX3408138.1 hypothetical protein [Phycisphaeraceae bacterium]